ncbi:MAG: hypothetical protein AAF085_14170, partial [Planctomycetota bacterium]
KATKHYEHVIELAGESFLAQKDRAERALERNDLLNNPVAFAEPEAAPIPEPIEGDPVSPDPAFPTLPLPPAE